MDRAQRAQPLEAGVGARALVDGELAVAQRDRDDLGVEAAVLDGVERPAGGSAARRRRAPRGSGPTAAATRSAVCGMVSVVSASKRRVGEPPADRGVEGGARACANALVGFSVTQGARVIDSTPPATTTSASPGGDHLPRGGDRGQARGAQPVDGEARAPTGAARPAAAPSGRRCGCPRRPGWPRRAPPRRSSSGSMPARATASRTTRAARSSGRTRASPPPYRPIGRADAVDDEGLGHGCSPGRSCGCDAQASKSTVTASLTG